MFLGLKRTVSSRWLFWVPSSFVRAWKFRIQRSFDLSKHALLVLKRTCLGAEILKTNSYLCFEACVVGAQNNRLIKMAVLSTSNLASVWVFMCKFLSIFRDMYCWCSRQSSHRDGCFEYPQPLLGCGNLKYKILCLF